MNNSEKVWTFTSGMAGLVLAVVATAIVIQPESLKIGIITAAAVLILLGWMMLFFATRFWGVTEIELEAQRRELQERTDSMLAYFAERVVYSPEEAAKGERRMAASMGQSAIATKDKDEISFWAVHRFARSELKLETRPKITDYIEVSSHRKKAA